MLISVIIKCTMGGLYKYSHIILLLLTDEERVVGEVITKRRAYSVAIINFVFVVWHYNTCIARTPKSSGVDIIEGLRTRVG